MPVQRVRQALLRIDAMLTDGAYAPLELERALRDLQKVESRLDDRDYKKSNFDENTFCMQERSRMLLVEIDFYTRVGRLWSTVLEAIGVTRVDDVLDVGPGWFPKVEMGLIYANYTGRLRIIDQSAEAIANLRTFLAAFDPKYAIEAVITDFLTARLSPSEVVAGNHFVDDVIVDRYCRDHDEDPSTVYREEASYERVWRDILEHREGIAEPIIESMTETFDRLVSPGGTLVVAQYPSYMERRLRMPQIDRMCRDVLDAVGHRLEPRGFSAAPDAVRLLAPGDDEFFGREAFFVFRRSA